MAARFSTTNADYESGFRAARRSDSLA